MEKNDIVINKISVPRKITIDKPHLFQPSMIELPIVIRVSPIDFLDTLDKNTTEKVDEIDIIILSDLDDITFSHYMTKINDSTKTYKKFFEEDYCNFDYN